MWKIREKRDIQEKNQRMNKCKCFTHPPVFYLLSICTTWNSDPVSAAPAKEEVGVGGVPARARERVNDTCLD